MTMALSADPRAVSLWVHARLVIALPRQGHAQNDSLWQDASFGNGKLDLHTSRWHQGYLRDSWPSREKNVKLFE